MWVSLIQSFGCLNRTKKGMGKFSLPDCFQVGTVFSCIQIGPYITGSPVSQAFILQLILCLWLSLVSSLPMADHGTYISLHNCVIQLFITNPCHGIYTQIHRTYTHIQQPISFASLENSSTLC